MTGNIRFTLVFILAFMLLGGCKKYRQPSCEIVEPEALAFFGKGEVIDIRVEAEDPNGNNLEIQFFVNKEGVYSTTRFPYVFSWDTDGYETGDYTIEAKAVDSEGWINKDTRTISIGISTPRISTLDVSSITLTSATVGGEIINDGGAPVFETGIYWSKNKNPENGGTRKRTTLTQEAFTTAITGLATNTEYYYRAYAANDEGEDVGEQKSFRTLGNELGLFTDSRDGREYRTVRIANQTWMAENLAYLPEIHSPYNGSKYSPKYYVYGYEGVSVQEAKGLEEYNEYGVLYNWPAAINACPEGWHLPTDDDWKTLESNLGMSPVSVDNAGWRGSIEGSMMKDRSGWKAGGNGSNVTDFSALAGGYRVTYDTTEFETVYGNFWTSTEFNATDAWSRYLYYNNNGVYRGTFSKDFGFSVRCVKD